MRRVVAVVGLAAAALVWAEAEPPVEEKRLRGVRQLTFGGENAEAYFSADDRWLIFQAAGGAVECDQIFIMAAEAAEEEEKQIPRRQGGQGLGMTTTASGGPRAEMVSTGAGKATCAYFFPDGERILYSSTHHAGPACPPRPDYSRGYVWPVYADYDIYVARRDPSTSLRAGGGELRRLTATPGYDAEATIARDGRKIVFTSMRDGDLDIYVMDADGGNVRRLTNEVGYDGGAFFSPDGTKIVYRAHHPETPEGLADYRALLAQGLLRPTRLEIWVMDADGGNKRQLTRNGAANFAPSWHPDGRRVIFASNVHELGSRNFDLYLINLDGTGLERVTTHPEFDGFPMFSSDGRRLVWASNRGSRVRGETNIFIAEWVE